MGEDEFERLYLPSKSGMPPLTRQTTYSSLPPSPRYDEYDIGTEKVKEFEEALGRLAKGGLRRSSVSASAVPRSLSVNDLRPSDGKVEEKEDEGMSMWDLLKDEVGVEDWDGWIVDGKWERIANFLAVPLAVEKVSFLSLKHPTQKADDRSHCLDHYYALMDSYTTSPSSLSELSSQQPE